MTVLNINGKELNVKYGYEVTWKSGVVKKLVNLSTSATDDPMEKIDEVMSVLPELLLIGLQKYHADEYGYKYETNEGKEDMLHKVCDLLDDYFDEEGADFQDLLEKLQNELLENGFLATMFQKEVERKRKK